MEMVAPDKNSGISQFAAAGDEIELTGFAGQNIISENHDDISLNFGNFGGTVHLHVIRRQAAFALTDFNSAGGLIGLGGSMIGQGIGFKDPGTSLKGFVL